MTPPEAHSHARSADAAEVDAGPFHFKMTGASAKNMPLILMVLALFGFAGFGWVIWDRMNGLETKMETKLDKIYEILISRRGR